MSLESLLLINIFFNVLILGGIAYLLFFRDVIYFKKVSANTKKRINKVQ